MPGTEHATHRSSHGTQSIAGHPTRCAALDCPRLVPFAALCILCALLLAACGGKTQSGGGTDTSTDWLSCERDTDCSSNGTTCACGFCTTECQSDKVCNELVEDAVCQPAPNGCGVVQLCAPMDFKFASGAGPKSEIGTSGAPRECRSSCNSTSCDDPGPALAEFPNFGEQKAQWDQQRRQGACQFTYAQGACAGGVRFLHQSGGKTSETRYFDASGAALGLSSQTDEADSDCGGSFYWPEPVLCEDGEVTELFCGTPGGALSLRWSDGTRRGVELPLPEALTPPDECRSKCELAGSCDELTPLADHDGTLEEWTADDWCVFRSFGPSSPRFLEGTCDSGLRFIHRIGGFVSETRYFDAAGSFVGLATSTDVIDSICQGQGFWPEPTLCANATIAKIYCGGAAVGDVITLPWATGAPVDPFSSNE